MLGSNPSVGADGSTDAEAAAIGGGLCLLSSGCPQSDKSQGGLGDSVPHKELPFTLSSLYDYQVSATLSPYDPGPFYRSDSNQVQPAKPTATP
jgi:hypothetical protein